MMYGTLLSPFLLLLGYSSAEVVPAILLSQMLGGLVGSFSHHANRNANFSELKGDLRLVLVVFLLGMTSATCGVLLASHIPGLYLKIYIACLAIVMGLLCLASFSYAFSWSKIALISILASFNKSVTGGGFGPLCSTGLIIGGVSSRLSVAVTTFSEVPLCFYAFVLYSFYNGLPASSIMMPLVCGSALGGVVGPIVCARVKPKILKLLVGVLAVICGAALLLKL